jgi:hypothetical protein
MRYRMGFLSFVPGQSDQGKRLFAVSVRHDYLKNGLTNLTIQSPENSAGLHNEQN